MTEIATIDMNWSFLMSVQGTKTAFPVTIVDEEALPTISADNLRSLDSSDQYVNGWISRIREGLYSVSLVEDIFVSIEDNNVDVWVVIPERDLAALDQLANIEWKMLKMFVSGEHPAFLIDFHIIYRCGRNVEELAPTRAIRLPREV